MNETNGMQITNYHTHTFLCNHADGLPSDYVLQAKKDGCTQLGFSDHCPYPVSDDDYWENIRMKVEEVSFYRAEVQKAASLVDFPVKCGFECEWDEKYASWYKDMLLGEFGADYLVLGLHWLTRGKEHLYAAEFSSRKDFHMYVDQTISGIQSGLFAFYAHPDLFMRSFVDWDDDLACCSAALIDAAVGMKLPLEINGLGMQREVLHTKKGIRYQYPYDEFWQLAAEKNAGVICNSDAHSPSDVIRNALAASEYAEKFGFTPVFQLKTNAL